MNYRPDIKIAGTHFSNLPQNAICAVKEPQAIVEAFQAVLDGTHEVESHGEREGVGGGAFSAVQDLESTVGEGEGLFGVGSLGIEELADFEAGEAELGVIRGEGGLQGGEGGEDVCGGGGGFEGFFEGVSLFDFVLAGGDKGRGVLGEGGEMKGRKVLGLEEGFRGLEEKGMRESFAGFKERGWVGFGGGFGKGEAREERRRDSSHHGVLAAIGGREVKDLEIFGGRKAKTLVKPFTVNAWEKLKLHCKI